MKAEALAPTELKPEVNEVAEEHNGDGDEPMYGGEDLDDEIDFNLGGGNGNGNGYDASSTQHEAHGPGIKEDG